MQKIKIGTRGSKLALYQAELVKSKIEALNLGITVEIVIIKTKGDEILDIALSKIGDKGLFTKELEVALHEGGIDIAVHSLKDLPTELSEQSKLAAVLERADFRDALVSKNHKKLSEFTPSDRIATSSLRRKAGILNLNKDLQIVDIRGNVNTRLKKMEDGYCDAIIMAAAGLQRLGLDHYITEILEPTVMIPAVSQGAIAIESRKGDARIDAVCDRLNHIPTWKAIAAERTFMNTLQGGCQIPVGCYTKVVDNSFEIIGFIASVDGQTYLKDSLSGSLDKAQDMGKELAVKLLARGGDVILKDIRTHN